jgi:hypothetical protein
VLNGILWVLRTGAPWADLPDRYPSYQTCHRRFQQWVRCGVLKDILSLLAEALHDEGYLDVQEAFIDGSFARAKKGGNCVGKTKRGKGTKIMAIADRHGLPAAVHVESATPHEVTLVKAHRRADAGPVAAYFAAEKKADVDALARCFAEDGVVRDEGRTFEGVAAIRQWNAAARDKYHHTIEPIVAVERDGKTVVIGKVSGNFPNSPVNLEHIFGLRGDKIASLEIRG